MTQTNRESDLQYWLAALHLPTIGPVTFKRWLSQIPDIKQLFTADTASLEHAGFSTKEIKIVKDLDWAAVEKDLRWCEATSCQVLTISDEAYPGLLREIHNAPLVLFVLGNSELLSKPQIAVVGSRHPSVIGCENAENFSQQLATEGFVITSGMALGIDTASHRGALITGKTIAVLGSGLDTIYPPSNRRLADEIQKKGALVSELPPFELPKPKYFPLRNRIISGLSLGVLVVEAAIRSGSLITARYALDQGREVFAIPGSIHNPLARGCHDLLRQGAKLVEEANDIIEELSSFYDLFPPPKQEGLSEKQQNLLAQIGYETTSVDTIIVRSGLTSSEVSSILLSLELDGHVQTAMGGYSRINK